MYKSKKISIRWKIIGSNAIILLSITMLLLFLTFNIYKGNEIIVQQEETLNQFNDLQHAVTLFSQIKYWLADLASSLLTESENNANTTHQALIVILDNIPSKTNIDIEKIKDEVQQYFDRSIEAVDAYADDNRVLGNALLSQSRTIATGIDLTLSERLAASQHEAYAAGEKIKSANKVLLITASISLAFIIIIGVVFSWLLSSNIVKSLKKAAAIAYQLAQGDLSKF